MQLKSTTIFSISIISLLVLGLIFFRIQGGFSKQSYYSFQELTAAELIQKKNKYFLFFTPRLDTLFYSPGIKILNQNGEFKIVKCKIDKICHVDRPHEDLTALPLDASNAIKFQQTNSELKIDTYRYQVELTQDEYEFATTQLQKAH